MKYFLLLFILFSWPLFAFASCPNFSGEYKLENSKKTNLEIRQLDCERIELDYSLSGGWVESYELNGKRVKFYENDSFSLETYVTPRISSDAILIDVENFWIDEEEVQRLTRKIYFDKLDSRILHDDYGYLLRSGRFVPTMKSQYLLIN